MSKPLENIEIQAASLSETERAALALHLIESLEPAEDVDWQAAWLAECDARWAHYSSGSDRGAPVSEVIARVRAALR